jgi:large subunit ribosomal protein L9
MSGVAELLQDLELQFFSKAGETGKLYGSITSQMIVDEIHNKLAISLDRHQIEVAPIRTLGEHLATVRLTVDLNPKIKVLVNREGEAAKVSARKQKVEEPIVEAAAVVEETITPAAEEAMEAATEETEEKAE